MAKIEIEVNETPIKVEVFPDYEFAEVIGAITEIIPGNNITVDATDPEKPIISSIPGTSAGITNRKFYTGDLITLNSGTYKLTNIADKGSIGEVNESIILTDQGKKAFFTKDYISSPQYTISIINTGTYSGNLTFMGNGDSGLKIDAELYHTDGNGNPIDSGIDELPIGSLGVKPIAYFSSGIIHLPVNQINQVPFSGNILNEIHMFIGERLRWVFSCEKTEVGDNITATLYAGFDHNSFIDIPVLLDTDNVKNLSGANGASVTDALDFLNNNKINTLVGVEPEGSNQVSNIVWISEVDYQTALSSDLLINNTLYFRL